MRGSSQKLPRERHRALRAANAMLLDVVRWDGKGPCNLPQSLFGQARRCYRTYLFDSGDFQLFLCVGNGLRLNHDSSFTKPRSHGFAIHAE